MQHDPLSALEADLTPDRLSRHEAVTAELTGLSDADVRRLLVSAGTSGGSIGGETAVVAVGGIPVFTKRLALTDREQEPAHLRSTANLFDLPTSCHYGVGAPSTSAWRELRAHEIASRWVRDGTCDGFPLLHHWRVLPQDPPRGLDCAEHGDVDTWVAFWHDSRAVRQRLEALAQASADVVLFVEHAPQDLATWLADRRAEGPEAVDAVLDSVLTQLVQAARCMATNGFWHFDAHLRNVVVDGDRLRVTDFGLASSSAFSTTAEEAQFLATHADHDLAHVVTGLVDWVVTHLTEPSGSWTSRVERDDLVRACASGHEPPELLPTAAAIVRRYAPVAVVMNDWYSALHGLSRWSRYPQEDVRRACRAAGLPVDAVGGAER